MQLVQDVKVFDSFNAQLLKIEEDNENTKFDYHDEKGRKEAKSHVYKLRQTKSAVEKTRKEAKQASLEYGRKIDVEAREVTQRIEKMMNVHLAPVKEIEDEIERVKKIISDNIEKIRSFSQKINPRTQEFFTSQELEDRHLTLSSMVIDESYGEWESTARQSRIEALANLDKFYEEAHDREAKEKELARFQKEEKERKAKEAKEKLEREAKEKAEFEAQQKVERERKEAKAREEKIKRDAQEREERIKREAKEREDKIKREAQIKEERLKREKEEQARKSKEREDRIKREAKEKADREEKEKLRREADQRNRQSVEDKIVNDLRAIGIEEKTSRHLITAINQNKVSKLTISY